MGHQMQMYYCEIISPNLLTVKFVKFACFSNNAFTENVEAEIYNKGHEAYVCPML